MNEENSILGIPGQTTAKTFWAKVAANGLSCSEESEKPTGRSEGFLQSGTARETRGQTQAAGMS